jgi:AmiR/NasT family two-component response regulator
LEVKEVCEINDNEVVKKPTVEKDVNEDTVDEVEETRDQEMNDRNAKAENDVIVKEFRESSTKIRESLLVLQSTVTKGYH